MRFGWMLVATAMVVSTAAAQEKVYSGPQAGEKVTGFKAVELAPGKAGPEFDVVRRHDGKASVVVFVHGIERSLLPLATVIDEYGHEKREKIATSFVMLTGDRLAMEKRLPMVNQSLKFHSPWVLSVDGAEGPGNWGLNRQCLLTIVISRDGKVTANFALVQPGIADAPAVIKAMAEAVGDEKPPTAEQLRERRGAAMGEMRRGPATRPARPGAGANLPGAAPTDEKLVGMLRAFIRPGNDDATVDAVVGEVEAYVKGNADLTKQAIDGWVRVLHLKYGTEYAQKKGTEMVERLKKQ